MRAHDFYIGSIHLPISPSSIEISSKGKNKVLDLINGNEFNVINKPGLLEYRFSFFLPSRDAPVVTRWLPPFKVIEAIEKYRNEKEVIPFIIIRHDPGLKNSIIRKATVEDFSYKEDSKDAPGLSCEIRLKFFIPLKTRELKVKKEGEKIVLVEGSSIKPKVSSIVGRRGEPLNVTMRRAGVSAKSIDSVMVNNDIRDAYSDMDGVRVNVF